MLLKENMILVMVKKKDEFWRKIDETNDQEKDIEKKSWNIRENYGKTKSRLGALRWWTERWWMHDGEHKDYELLKIVKMMNIEMKVKTNMSTKVKREMKINKTWTNKHEYENHLRVTCLVSMLHNVWSLPHLPSICLPISGRLEGDQRRGQPSDAHCATASQVKNLEVGIAAPTAQMAVGTQRSIFAAWQLATRSKRKIRKVPISEIFCCCNWPFALPTYLQASPQPYSQCVKHLLELKGRVAKHAIWFRVEMKCAGLYWNCILPSNSPVWGPLLYGWPKEPTEDSKSMDLSAQALQKLRSHCLLWSWNRQDSAQPHAGKGNLSKHVISYPPNPEMRWTNWLFRRNGTSNAHSSIDNTHISCQLVLES